MGIIKQQIGLMLLVALSTSVVHADEGTKWKNAVFNSDFRYEQEYWHFYPAGLVRPRVDHIPIVDATLKIMVVEWGDINQQFQMCQRYAIHVQKDTIYKVEFIMKGKGEVKPALNFYDTEGESIGGSHFETVDLTEQFRTYAYEFTPKHGLASVRPAVYFQPTGGREAASQYCMISEINLFVPENQFETAIKEWPKDWEKMDTPEDCIAFFKEKFKDFKGFTADDITKMSNAVQVDDIIVPPYQPIQQGKANDYRLTTAIWRFTKEVLPSEILIFDKASVIKNMAFIMDTGNGSTVWQPTADLQTECLKKKVVLSQDGNCGKLKIKMDGVLHYDGFMQVSVRMIPDGKIKVRNAELVFIFPAEIAKYIRFDTLTGGGFDIKGWRYGFGPIPGPDEEVKNLFMLDGGRAKNEWTPVIYRNIPSEIWKWREEYLPYFWIGDEEKGLGWVAESDQGWEYTPGEDATLIIEREKDTVKVRVVFIARETELSAPRSIKFALQHTPPKPVVSNWYNTQFIPGGSDMKRRGVPSENLKTDQDYVAYLLYHHWSTGCSSPLVAKPDVLASCVNEAHKFGIAVCPYQAPTHVAMNTSESFYYGVLNKEWDRMPLVMYWPKNIRDERDVGAANYKVCVNSFFAEWMAYGIGKMIDEYKIGGIYFDNCTIRSCTNTLHGCGYVDPKGQVKPTVPFYAMRNFMMMVRNEFAKRNVVPHLWCHAAEYPGQVNFIDYSALGEGCVTTDLTKLLSLAEFRANYIGPNQLGYIRMILPQFNLTEEYRKNKKYEKQWTRTALALALPHGTRIWPAWCDTAPIFKVNDIMRQLGKGAITFLPYWQWEMANKLSDNKLLLTLYLKSDKALLAVGNLATESQKAVIPITEIKRMLPEYKTITDPMDGLPVADESGNITFEVGPKDFRLLFLE